MQGHRTYICQTCNAEGRRVAPGICCGKPRVLKMSLPILCRKCQRPFLRTMGKTVDCPDCTGHGTMSSRRKRAKDRAVVATAAKRAPVIPCARCIHGASSVHSESGWECKIQAAGRCGPYGVARLFEEVQRG